MSGGTNGVWADRCLQVLQQDSAFLQRVLDQLDDGVCFVDRDRRILYWNRGAERLSGYSAEEVVGLCCRDNLLVHTDDCGRCLCVDRCPLEAAMYDGSAREAHIYLLHKEGHRVPVAVRANPIVGADGTIMGAVEVFSDRSPALAALARLREMERLAMIDPLTGLANRRFSDGELRTRWAGFRSSGAAFAVLFCDVDRFKGINDNFGHHAGDAVLRMVAATLCHTVESGDFVGRWGGEEFVVFASRAASIEYRALAERLCGLVGASTLPGPVGRPLSVTLSIGIAEAEAADSLESLLARADARMYAAKRTGRNRIAG